MIDIQNLAVTAGAFSLKSVSFQVRTGAYGVLMGKTGSGKTTVLEAICGLRPAAAGRIALGGRDVTALKAAERGIGYVPQDGALFLTMNVRDHLEFALRIRRWPSASIRERVGQLAALLGLEPLLQRTPHNLSGGERQRVALGRALSFRPLFLCLDEPLSALDDDTRDDMCRLLQHAQRETGVTTLHVTHNRREAEMLADQLLELSQGQVRAQASGGRQPPVGSQDQGPDAPRAPDVRFAPPARQRLFDPPAPGE
jgi:molybdate/tungstate transport system ATP-binding protein